MQSVDVKDLENYKGKDMGHSDWMSIDQDRINLFADATGTISGYMLICLLYTSDAADE